MMQIFLDCKIVNYVVLHIICFCVLSFCTSTFVGRFCPLHGWSGKATDNKVTKQRKENWEERKAPTVAVASTQGNGHGRMGAWAHGRVTIPRKGEEDNRVSIVYLFVLGSVHTKMCVRSSITIAWIARSASAAAAVAVCVWQAAFVSGHADLGAFLLDQTRLALLVAAHLPPPLP